MNIDNENTREAQDFALPEEIKKSWNGLGDQPPGPATEEEVAAIDAALAELDLEPDEPEAETTSPEVNAEYVSAAPHSDEPIDLCRPAPLEDMEVIRKREPWSVIKKRFVEEEKRKRTAGKTARQARWRAGKRAKATPKPPKPPRFQVKVVTPEMEAHFADYVRRADSHFARSLHGRFRVSNLIIALKIFLDTAHELGRDPHLSEFDKAMNWKSKDKGKARRAVRTLRKVFDEGGFGTAAELAEWTAKHSRAGAAEWSWASTERVGPASTEGVGEGSSTQGVGALVSS
jgi:hypothetical protein